MQWTWKLDISGGVELSGGNPQSSEKTPCCMDENQQQTQPTYDVKHDIHWSFFYSCFILLSPE